MNKRVQQQDVEPSHYVAVHSIQHGKTLYKAGDKIPAAQLDATDRANLLKAKSVYPFLGDDAKPGNDEEE